MFYFSKMAKHLKTGRQGEELARIWLENQGFRILHRNWKYSYYELDIVTEKDDVLHFVEVKTRTTDTYGYPEEGVTSRKLERLMQAGGAYLELHPAWKRIQYDILSVQLFPGREPEIFFIEDIS